MRLAVIGNGPSYIDYDNWGDIAVGCKLGAPLPINYEFTTNSNVKIFDRILQDPTWNVSFSCRQIFPLHMHYQLENDYSLEQKEYIKSKMFMAYDKHLYKALPSAFQPNSKKLAQRKQQNLKGFDYNTDLKKISTGHWAIIFSMILLKPSKIRCYGFDAHFDPTTKATSTSPSITATPDELARRYERGWDYFKGAYDWLDTLRFLRKLYQIPIELVPPK